MDWLVATQSLSRRGGLLQLGRRKDHSGDGRCGGRSIGWLTIATVITRTSDHNYSISICIIPTSINISSMSVLYNFTLHKMFVGKKAETIGHKQDGKCPLGHVWKTANDHTSTKNTLSWRGLTLDLLKSRATFKDVVCEGKM